MIKQVDGVWTFVRGKHGGKSLEEVAAAEPGYLQWLHRESKSLSDEAFYALEDAMEKHEIEVK